MNVGYMMQLFPFLLFGPIISYRPTCNNISAILYYCKPNITCTRMKTYVCHHQAKQDKKQTTEGNLAVKGRQNRNELHSWNRQKRQTEEKVYLQRQLTFSTVLRLEGHQNFNKGYVYTPIWCAHCVSYVCFV